MTQTARRPEVVEARREERPPGRRRDPVSLFLRFGALALAVLVVGFGLLYWFDQRTPQQPSIVTQAIVVAEDAVRGNPNDVVARIRLATMYQEAARPDDAIRQYDEIIKVDAGNADAHMGKGIVLLDKGDLLAASAEFSAVTQAQREGEFAGADTRLQASFYYLGVIANRQSQPDQALEQLGRALVINPTDSDALYQVGIAQALQGRHDEAVATFRRALAFVPTGWCEPYQQMGASFGALGQPEQAGYAGAMDAFCRGRADEARQTLQGLTDGPAGVDAMLGLGLVAQVEKDADGAIGWYRKALERDPRNIQAISALAGLGVAPDGTAKK